jgi:hypothetical protein
MTGSPAWPSYRSRTGSLRVSAENLQSLNKHIYAKKSGTAEDLQCGLAEEETRTVEEFASIGLLRKLKPRAFGNHYPLVKIRRV